MDQFWINKLLSIFLKYYKQDPNEPDFNPKINEKSVNLNRGYDDLVAWKQKVDAKNVLLKQYKDEEEQREQTEQFVYTNPASNRIVGETRNQQRIEDILLQKGEEKKQKIIQKEREIYGSHGKPQINDYQLNEYTQKNVYTRALNVQAQQQEEKKKEQQKDERKKALQAKEQDKKREQAQAGTTNWNMAFKNPPNVLQKGKNQLEKAGEQQKLMDLMKSNFESAKQKLLQKKQQVEEAQVIIEQENEHQKEIEEQLQISNFVAYEEEVKKRSQNPQQSYQLLAKSGSQQGSQSQEENQYAPEEQQTKEETKEEAKKDNRIIFLTPNGNVPQTDQPTIPKNYAGINVMNPKFTLLTKPNEQLIGMSQRSNQHRQKSHDNQETIKVNSASKLNALSGTKAQNQNMNKSSSSVSSFARFDKQAKTPNDELIERKASPQFKQFFKPIAWSEEAARKLAENNGSLEQIPQDDQFKSDIAIKGTQAPIAFNSKESFGGNTQTQIKQSFIQSSQQQSLQHINKSQQHSHQQIPLQNQSMPLQNQQMQLQEPQEIVQTLPGVSEVSQNLLYSKTFNKQLEESVNNVNYHSSPKHVYLNFKDSNMHQAIEEETDPLKKKLQTQQQALNSKYMTQRDIEEQQRKLKEWQFNKNSKLAVQRYQKEADEIKNCTFKPELTSLSNTAKKSLMLSSAGEQQLKFSTQSPSKSKIDSYTDARKQKQEMQKTLTKQSINPSQNFQETITISSQMTNQKQELLQPQLQEQIQQHLMQHLYTDQSQDQQSVKQQQIDYQVAYNLVNQEIQQSN